MKRHEVQKRCDVLRRGRERKWEKVLLKERGKGSRERKAE